MISYYELLGMIKEGKTPNKIKVHLNSTSKIYESDVDRVSHEFSCYVLYGCEEEDDNYHYYLAEDFLESSMFEKTIEILDEKKIEKLEPLQKDWMTLDDIKFTFSNSEMIIVNKINEIIDLLNSKGE